MKLLSTAHAPSAIAHPDKGGPPPLLEVTDVSKHFGPLQALANVSLRLRPGTCHALLGGNGAGKSTLVKCIMGTYRADSGTVRVGNQSVAITNPRQAHALGLGMVYQHFTLVENMTVVENLVMAREHVPAVIDWKAEAGRLAAFMSQMPFQVDPTAVVRNLAAGQKQKVEILKQLYLHRKVILLDEPTSVLTPDEGDEVLGMLRRMCNDGSLSVLIITHKFRELAYCDEVTVLRQGRFAGAGAVGDLSHEALGKMMMGQATLPEPAVRDSRPIAAPPVPTLSLDGVEAENEVGVPVLRGISLRVNAREIVGVAGVSGNGQRELVQVLAGQRVATGGRVCVNGEPYRATRSEIGRRHFHVLPEMPLQNACVPTMTVAENLAFRVFDRPPLAWLRSFINRKGLRRQAEDRIRRYNVRPSSPGAKIGNLSGGNVQRAVLARELGEEVEVLIAANPCFGLDFKAVAEIRSQIMQARNRGAAVLLVSEDLDEILELADRILVISGGTIVHETPALEADRGLIGRYMAGH
jgi:ABC-type uncharacterized transport system ATPase subunit